MSRDHNIFSPWITWPLSILPTFMDHDHKTYSQYSIFGKRTYTPSLQVSDIEKTTSYGCKLLLKGDYGFACCTYKPSKEDVEKEAAEEMASEEMASEEGTTWVEED